MLVTWAAGTNSHIVKMLVTWAAGTEFTYSQDAGYVGCRHGIHVSAAGRGERRWLSVQLVLDSRVEGGSDVDFST